jgi:hypothetical protein
MGLGIGLAGLGFGSRFRVRVHVKQVLLVVAVRGIVVRGRVDEFLSDDVRFLSLRRVRILGFEVLEGGRGARLFALFERGVE